MNLLKLYNMELRCFIDLKKDTGQMTNTEDEDSSEGGTGIR